MKSLALALAAGLTLGLATATGHATVIFTLGNHPQPGEENILFGAKEVGTTITGATQTSNIPVEFTSTTNTLNQNSSGQAMIVNDAGGNLTDITVSVPGHVFGDLIVDLNKANGSLIDITANELVGGPATFSFTGGNGSNFITITTGAGELLTSVTFDSTLGWQQFKQPRISGVTHDPALPEPSALALIGSALALLGLMWRRKSV